MERICWRCSNQGTYIATGDDYWGERFCPCKIGQQAAAEFYAEVQAEIDWLEAHRDELEKDTSELDYDEPVWLG